MTDILQRIAPTQYPKKADLPDIEAACVQRQAFLEREELTMPALKKHAVIHCFAHGELAALYFFKARLLYQTRSSKVIARSLLEETIPEELMTMLTIADTSMPKEFELEEDPYELPHINDIYRQMIAPDWREALRSHYQKSMWGLKFILANEWKGQRCRELSWGIRYSAQFQMPEIAEAILHGKDKPLPP